MVQDCIRSKQGMMRRRIHMVFGGEGFGGPEPQPRSDGKPRSLERHFKVQLSTERSPKWTPESEILEVRVRLYEIPVPKEVENLHT